jgi:hypothetical protein
MTFSTLCTFTYSEWLYQNQWNEIENFMCEELKLRSNTILSILKLSLQRQKIQINKPWNKSFWILLWHPPKRCLLNRRQHNQQARRAKDIDAQARRRSRQCTHTSHSKTLPLRSIFLDRIFVAHITHIYQETIPAARSKNRSKILSASSPDGGGRPCTHNSPPRIWIESVRACLTGPL